MTRRNGSPADDVADAGYVMGPEMAMRIYIPKSLGQLLSIGPAFAYTGSWSLPDRTRHRDAYGNTRSLSWTLQMR
jgi:hypothetical protein